MSAGEGLQRDGVPGLEHLPVPAFALNAAGAVVAWNPALARLTGVSDVAMVGRTGGAHAFPLLGSTGSTLSDLLLDPTLEAPPYLSAVEPDGPGLSGRLAADLVGVRRTLYLRAVPILDRGVTVGTVEVVLEPPGAGDGRSGTHEALARLLRTTRHDIKNELTIVLGYIGLARDAVEDPVTCVGLDRAIGAAGEIGRLIDFSREVQELGERPAEARELGSLIRTAADAADLAGIDCRIAVPRGTITADPAIFRVLEHLFERLFQYSAATVPRPAAIEVSTSSENSFAIVYLDDAPHADRNLHPDRAFCRQLDTGLAAIRELLSLDGIGFSVTAAPLRVELHVPEDRVWTAEKKE